MTPRSAGERSCPASTPEHQSLLDRIWGLVFPPRCVGCGGGGAWLCPTCLDRIEYYRPPWPHFLDPVDPLQEVRSAAHLSDPLRLAIHSFKYEGLRALAGTLGQILYACWASESWPVDVIVPVPLHPSRLRERGYNQSALLARELSRCSGLPVLEGVLLRVVDTRPQVGLSATERTKNVKGAFRCKGSLTSQHILLVDDVMTTGATLRACGRELLQAGARAVWGLTLAHD